MVVAARMVSIRCVCSLARARILLPPCDAHSGIDREDEGEVQGSREDDDCREQDRIEEQDAGGDERHDTVDDGGDQPLRDGLLDRLHCADAGEDVADVAFSKKSAGRRIMWRTRLPTIWKLRDGEHFQRPAAQRLDRTLDDHQGAERQRQHEQKVLVVVEHRLVDHQLDLERRRKGRDLQRDRERRAPGSTRPTTRSVATTG